MAVRRFLNAVERLKLLTPRASRPRCSIHARHPVGERSRRRRAESRPICRAYIAGIADFCRASKGRLISESLTCRSAIPSRRPPTDRAVKDGCRGAFVLALHLTHKAHGHPVHDRSMHRAVELERADRSSRLELELRSPRFENGIADVARLGDRRRRPLPPGPHTPFFRFRHLRPLSNAQARVGSAAPAGSASGSTALDGVVDPRLSLLPQRRLKLNRANISAARSWLSGLNPYERRGPP